MRDELGCISVAECFVFNTYNLVRGRYLHICLSLDLSHHKGLHTGPVVQVSDHSVPTKLETTALVSIRGGPQQTVRCVSWGMIFCLEAAAEGGGNFKVFSPPPGEEKCTLAAL